MPAKIVRYGVFSILCLMQQVNGQAAPVESGLDCHTASAETTLGMVNSKIRKLCFSGDFQIDVKGFHWDNPRFQISFKNGRPVVKDLVAGVPAKAQLLVGPEYTMPILSLTTLEDSGEESITTVTRLMINAEKISGSEQVSYRINVLDVVTSMHSYNEATSRTEHFSGPALTLSRIQPAR